MGRVTEGAWGRARGLVEGALVNNLVAGKEVMWDGL